MRNYNTVNQEFEHTVMKSGDVHIGKLLFQYLYFLLVMSGRRGNCAGRHSCCSFQLCRHPAGHRAAVPWDTVSVAPGTYVENINILGKAITVQSQSGPEATIIDENKANSDVIFSSIKSPDSKMEGFSPCKIAGQILGIAMEWEKRQTCLEKNSQSKKTK